MEETTSKRTALLILRSRPGFELLLETNLEGFLTGAKELYPDVTIVKNATMASPDSNLPQRISVVVLLGSAEDLERWHHRVFMTLRSVLASHEWYVELSKQEGDES